MGDIVKPCDMLDYVQGDGTPLTPLQKLRLESLRVEVEGLIKGIIGDPTTATYTEFYPKDQTPGAWDGDPLNIVGIGPIYPVGMERGQVAKSYLCLWHTPVRSIVTVYENQNAWQAGTPGGDWPLTSLLPLGQYRMKEDSPGVCLSGILIREGLWPNVPSSVKVQYTAGYTADELAAAAPNIGMAVKIAVQFNWLNRLAMAQAQADGGRMESSFSVTDFSVSYTNAASMGYGAFNGAAGGGNATTVPQEALNMIGRNVNVARYF